MKAQDVELTYDERGLIPAIVQQHDTGEVLMMAWMNAESLELTRTTGLTWFWSRSRQELWNKGATSGNVQHVKELFYDCDADTLLVKVDAEGPATPARAAAFTAALTSTFTSVMGKGSSHGRENRQRARWRPWGDHRLACRDHSRALGT